MSSKSAIRLVIPQNAQSSLFKWVAILTGSKNALKGVGFFVGSLLLEWYIWLCKCPTDYGSGVVGGADIRAMVAVGHG